VRRAMWYNGPNKNEEWKPPQKVVSFDTVEDFWWCVQPNSSASFSHFASFPSLYNNLVPPSRLPKGGNYHLFKDGVEPMWEDKSNVKVRVRSRFVFLARRLSSRDPCLWLLAASGRKVGCQFEKRRFSNGLGLALDGGSGLIARILVALADGARFHLCAQLLAVIGEVFEDSDEVCGVVISPRKGQVSRPSCRG
jgi:hypothetical protein